MTKVSILIVEDEAVVALEMQSNLESMGFEVVGRADTGQKAIDMSLKHEPDIILMDIRLKGEMDGIDAAYEIKNQQNIPIIFLTAYAEEEKLKRAKETLPFGYLLKPVQDRDLNVAIEMALNNAKVDAERRQMEQELRTSKLFLDSIIDQNPNPVWILDRTGVMIRANEASQSFFHLYDKDTIGKYNIFEDNNIIENDLIDKIASIYKTGKSINFEIEYDTAKLSNLQLLLPTRVYLETTVFCIKDIYGDLTNLVVQHSDITQKKRTEASRFRLAEEFKRTIDGLQNQVFRYRIDKKGDYKITFSEGRIAKDMGLTTADVKGKTLTEIMGEKEREELLPYFEEAFGGARVSYEIKIAGKWYNTTLIPFEQSKKGKVLEIIGFAEDITIEKQTEEAYKQSETRFRVLAELAPVGIYLTDVKGNCLYVNRKWCEMAGMSNEQALGEGWKEGLHEDDRTIVFDSWNDMVANNDIWEQEYRFQDPDKNTTWVYGLASKITDTGGNSSGYIGVNLDISERKKTEQILRNAQRELEEEVEKRTFELKLAKEDAEVANNAKSEFLANISHELRNPMHQILSYSKYGVDKIDQEKQKLLHYFSQIRTSASKLMVLLNDLLDLSKMESGRMEYEKSDHFLEVIIDEVVDELKPSLKEKRLEVEIETLCAAKSVFCDNFKIAQVLRNLLSNSIKFSPEGEKIRIQLKEANLAKENSGVSAMQVSVFDQGVGIPETELDSIFDKFSQSSKTKSGAGGTGLGLAICREIVGAHQGKIWAEHNQPSGAIMNFIIPSIPQTEMGDSEQAPF